MNWKRLVGAIVGPPLAQIVWVELVHLRGPASYAPAAGLWYLSIPGCAVLWLLLGYWLVPRKYRDPRFDFALLYFSAGALVLLVVSFAAMINRDGP
jgi:hypothetical protein